MKFMVDFTVPENVNSIEFADWLLEFLCNPPGEVPYDSCDSVEPFSLGNGPEWTRMIDPTRRPMDNETRPLFAALASVLAAIEGGAIAEGEVEERTVTEDNESALIITVRREVRHFVKGET